MKQIAINAKEFDRIPEENGAIFDNTMIVYISFSSEVSHCLLS